MTFTNRLFGALMLCLPQVSSAMQVAPAHSGTWFDPTHPGHGLTVQILDDEQALVFWYVYGSDGDPVFIYSEGRIEGDSILAQGYAPRGMVFGSFDDSDFELRTWGTLELEFSGCHAAELRWSAAGLDGTDFGSGSLNLSRLAGIAGLECREPPLVAAGAWVVDAVRTDPGSGEPLQRRYPAAVDREGRLWAAHLMVKDGLDCAYAMPVVFGEPASADSGAPEMVLQALQNDATFGEQALDYCDFGGAAMLPVRFSSSSDGGTFGTSTSSSNPAFVEEVMVSRLPGAELNDPLVRPFDFAEIAGTVQQVYVHAGLFPYNHFELRIEADGSVCIAIGQRPCSFTGSVGQLEPDMAMFAVSLVDSLTGTRYAGKAWVYGDMHATSGSAEGRIAMALRSEDGRRALGLSPCTHFWSCAPFSR